MCFLSIMFIIGCVIGICVFLFNIIEDLDESEKFNVLNLLGLIVCIITIFSIFQFSTYTLENNIKNNHTYVVKGKINKIGTNDVIKIENTIYGIDFKYTIVPFILSDFAENDKVEVVIADSVFDSYIIKINKIEK